MKTHMRDLRLRNNAGMDFPTCQANAPLLDLEASRWEMTRDPFAATCKNCSKIYRKRYPWTLQPTKKG